LEFTIYSSTRIAYRTRLVFAEFSEHFVQIIYYEEKQGKETKLNLGSYAKEELKRLVKAL